MPAATTELKTVDQLNKLLARFDKGANVTLLVRRGEMQTFVTVRGSMAIELTLISRGYCHLCHDMEAALLPLAAEFGARVTVLDVDADPALEAKYDELVPVFAAR